MYPTSDLHREYKLHILYVCTLMANNVLFRMDEECVDLEYLRRQALNSVTPKVTGFLVYINVHSFIHVLHLEWDMLHTISLLTQCDATKGLSRRREGM